MSKKPKAQNYKPSEADKASASVAMAERRFFKENYDPLLQQMRDKSKTDDATKTLRARANADTMQALTENVSLGGTQRVDAGSDMAQALSGQLAQATESGKKIQNTMQTNVLGVARKQAADAQTGMAQAARLGTSEALARAKAKQTVAEARFNAGAQVGTALLAQGIENSGTTAKDADGNIVKGSFFTPAEVQTGEFSRFGYQTRRRRET